MWLALRCRNIKLQPVLQLLTPMTPKEQRTLKCRDYQLPAYKTRLYRSKAIWLARDLRHSLNCCCTIGRLCMKSYAVLHKFKACSPTTPYIIRVRLIRRLSISRKLRLSWSSNIGHDLEHDNTECYRSLTGLDEMTRA